jgi:glyoxylase-like metal-dependent hydrolase (beta-lactamase superfamily II)/8-oxo-dGTP pyrophosphatase MutT (NUDIX family)
MVMNVTTPKDAAAVILLKHNTSRQAPEVFWACRSEKLAFLGGFHAFPGGQMDAADLEVNVDNSGDPQEAAAISCAARELFEELGVLVARGGDLLTVGQRQSLLDDLESGRMTWSQLLNHYQLRLDARDFTYVGRWVTPPFSARRFDTWFFLVNCPPRQTPRVIPGELESGEWIGAREAFARWERAEVVAVPPTLHALKTLSGGLTDDLTTRFLSHPQANRETVRRIEFRPNFICFPLRTPTRPPATHTNSYLIYSSDEFLIVDPGSPYEEEQEALAAITDELITEGRHLTEILLTHTHPDHVGGVNALRKHLGPSIPVSAHRLSAEPLRGTIEVDRLLEDEEVIELAGTPAVSLRVLHTPGHARGHLCLYDDKTGTLLSGDNVVGLGSVLIDPPEGDMAVYLASLQRLRSLPNLSLMLGGHGPAMARPYQKIDEYISHRLERERNILAAVQQGATSPEQIVSRVYTDVSSKAHALAERAVLAHLQKLETESLVRRDGPFWHAS